METNTFATSTFIAAPEQAALFYLRDLRNLDEWTLYSRMIEQMDENTWRGTASGYQHDLFYHARPIETPLFGGVEWQCGFKYGEYFQCYPAFVFPASYVGSDEDGVYFHWLSFVGPERRTPMIMQGIHLVHGAEIRSLKGALERQAGLKQAATGRFEIKTSSIFVDAPMEMAASFLGDIHNLKEWAYFLRPSDKPGATANSFIDEYEQEVDVTANILACDKIAIIDFEHRYRKLNYVQRNCMVLVPCSYAFGNPDAKGCVQHRIAFFDKAAPPTHGKLQIEDYGAESMSLKRVLEHKAGNLNSFALGGSYIPAVPA